MKTSHILLVTALTSLSVQAATIANWKELNPNAAVPATSGMNTDSPTIGNGTANNADDAWVAGRFGTVGTPASVTLAIGETLTVSGTVILTGGLDVASNLRFGVFDESGKFDLNSATWSNGGWLLRAGTNADDGWHKARTDNAFVSTNPNAVRLSTTTTNTGGLLDGDSTASYAWSISVTRDSATTVDLFGSIVGGDNAFNQTYTSNDVTTTLFTYNAVGILLGGSLDMDQAAFSGVQYTVVPEPSAALLGGLGVLLLLRRRRA